MLPIASYHKITLTWWQCLLFMAAVAVDTGSATLARRTTMLGVFAAARRLPAAACCGGGGGGGVMNNGIGVQQRDRAARL